MTALPRQDQLFDAPPPSDATDEQPTANRERQQPPARPPFKQKSKPELEREGVKAVYLRRIGRPYAAVAQDHAAWTELKKVATSIAEIEEFWDYSLSLSPTAWLHAPTIWQLRRKWNDLATVLAKSRATSDDVYDCDGCGVRVDAAASGRIWFARLWLCSPCLKVGEAARAKVPPLSPWPKSPADPRVRDWQQAADLAVFEAVHARTARRDGR